MRKLFIAIILFLGVNSSLFAQAHDRGSYKKNYMEGNLNVGDNEYDEALKYFTYAYQYDSTNANINFKMGFCYLKSANHKHLAEKYLEKAIQNVATRYLDDEPSFKKAPIQAYFYLGQSYHLDGRLDDALKMYDTYESFVKPKDKEERALVEHYKIQVQNAKSLMAAPLNVTIKNLGDSINSEWPEYSPVITADEQVLYYTTRRPNTTGGERAPDGMYYEDIVVSYKDEKGNWSKPVSISPYINSNGHEATVSLSPDGQTLIIYRGDVGNGDLYYSSFDGKDWTIPLKFGSNINTEFWETHACLSRDGNTIYFVSDRPGGLGGRDIYRCVKLPNGQWSLATNIGPPINTPYDDDAPFIGADGVSFYYASSGDKSMGDFDIFYSLIDENGKFSEPINMGSPINTTDKDAFYVATPDNKRFYLSSAHEQFAKEDIHGKNYGESDIYLGSVDIIRENPMALFRGRFVPGPCDSLPDDLSVIVTSVSSGELVGTYRPQRRTGTFSIIIPPGSKYNFSYQQNGAELYNEEVFVPEDISYEEIQKAINIKPLKVCPGMAVTADTGTSKPMLNVLVLNNKREKKPVAKADVVLTAKSAEPYKAKSDEDGHVNGIALAAEKSYEITASLNDKKSAPVIFNTIGIKGAKIYDKTVYLERSSEDEIQFPLTVLVRNSKSKKVPVAGASVKVTGTDGSSFEGTTDAKGKLSGIKLNPYTNYEIDVTKGDLNAKGITSTEGLRKSKSIEKVIYMQGGITEIPDNSEFVNGCFTFHFKYNMNEIDESAPQYRKFIDSLVAISKSGKKITLNISASASTVPTRKFKNNEDLAKMRAEQSIVKIKNTLKLKGIGEENIVIASNTSSVNGPAYQHDAIANHVEYEKYQYIKACIAK